MLIHEIPSRCALEHGQRTALTCDDHQVTYAELDAFSTRLAERIRGIGLATAHGFLFADNSIEYAVGYFGIAKAGGLIAPSPVSMPHDRLAAEMEFSDAEYVVTQAKYAPVLREAAGRAGRVRALVIMGERGCDFTVELVGDLPAHGASANGLTERKADDPFILISTSGTASEPKRVMLSQRNLTSNMDSFLDVAQLTADDIGAIVLPMTAVGTNTTELLAYLSLGMTVHLYQGVFLIGKFCRVLAEKQVTVVNVTPFILNVMLSRHEEVAQKIGSVRKIFFASAPMAPDQFKRLISAFPTTQFFYGYGLTEASPRCSTLLPQHQRTKMGSSGTRLKNVKVAIVDEDGRHLPAGQIGEVVVQGPNVMLGYYKSPAKTGDVLRDGWLHTGDCGYQDGDGFLFIKGRKKNIIITRGINVSPEEVEQEILGHPEILEAYVSGHSDAMLGESIVAYLVPRENTQPGERRIKEFLRTRLDPVKIPNRFEFVPELKRNHNQKLIRD